VDLGHYPEYAGFFDFAAKGQLAFPFCEHCRRYHWYPMPRCPHCGSAGIDWVPVPGSGTLFSWTEVRYAFTEEVAGSVPYIIAVVAFAEAPDIRFVTRLCGIAPDEVCIGMALKPIFPSSDDKSRLIYFSPLC
jgi:uncharacterized OB-fold protein